MSTAKELRDRAHRLRIDARKAREMPGLLHQPQMKQEFFTQADELEKRAAALEAQADALERCD